MTDDQLLKQFFQSAKDVEIADNGFTERVIQRLPKERERVLSRLWTTLCIAVFMLLFVVLSGWHTIFNGIYYLLDHFPTTHNLVMLTLALSVIGLLAVTEIISRERCHAL